MDTNNILSSLNDSVQAFLEDLFIPENTLICINLLPTLGSSINNLLLHNTFDQTSPFWSIISSLFEGLVQTMNKNDTFENFTFFSPILDFISSLIRSEDLAVVVYMFFHEETLRPYLTWDQFASEIQKVLDNLLTSVEQKTEAPISSNLRDNISSIFKLVGKVCTHSIVAKQRFFEDNATQFLDLSFRILEQGVEPIVKSSCLECALGYVTGSPTIGLKVWEYLEACQIVPTIKENPEKDFILGTHGYVEELEVVEAKLGTYPLLVSLLRLLVTLARTSLPSKDFMKDSRTPGIRPYIEFVVKHGFLGPDVHSFVDIVEKQRIEALSFAFLNIIMQDSFDIFVASLKPDPSTKKTSISLQNLEAEPSFHVFQLFLSVNNFSSKALGIIMQGVEVLNTLRWSLIPDPNSSKVANNINNITGTEESSKSDPSVEPNQPFGIYYEHLVLQILNAFNFVYLCQDQFLSLVRPVKLTSNSNFGLNKLMSLDRFLHRNPISITTIADYISYKYNSLIPFYAIQILTNCSRPDFFDYTKLGKVFAERLSLSLAVESADTWSSSHASTIDPFPLSDLATVSFIRSDVGLPKNLNSLIWTASSPSQAPWLLSSGPEVTWNEIERKTTTDNYQQARKIAAASTATGPTHATRIKILEFLIHKSIIPPRYCLDVMMKVLENSDLVMQYPKEVALYAQIFSRLLNHPEKTVRNDTLVVLQGRQYSFCFKAFDILDDSLKLFHLCTQVPQEEDSHLYPLWAIELWQMNENLIYYFSTILQILVHILYYSTTAISTRNRFIPALFDSINGQDFVLLKILSCIDFAHSTTVPLARNEVDEKIIASHRSVRPTGRIVYDLGAIFHSLIHRYRTLEEVVNQTSLQTPMNPLGAQDQSEDSNEEPEPPALVQSLLAALQRAQLAKLFAAKKRFLHEWNSLLTLVMDNSRFPNDEIVSKRAFSLISLLDQLLSKCSSPLTRSPMRILLLSSILQLQNALKSVKDVRNDTLSNPWFLETMLKIVLELNTDPRDSYPSHYFHCLGFSFILHFLSEENQPKDIHLVFSHYIPQLIKKMIILQNTDKSVIGNSANFALLTRILLIPELRSTAWPILVRACQKGYLSRFCSNLLPTPRILEISMKLNSPTATNSNRDHNSTRSKKASEGFRRELSKAREVFTAKIAFCFALSIDTQGIQLLLENGLLTEARKWIQSVENRSIQSKFGLQVWDQLASLLYRLR